MHSTVPVICEMVTQTKIQVRSVEKKDSSQLANMIHFETFVHRHLDWRSPLDWIGCHPYLVAEKDKRIMAAMACPPEPPGIAWVRVFVCVSNTSQSEAWDMLWPPAKQHLSEINITSLAAIPLQKWFRELLEDKGFQHIHNVIALAWDNNNNNLLEPKPIEIRDMQEDELASIQKIDEAAFGPIWRNSLDSLNLAFNQAVSATVAVDQSGLTGFQISTPSPYGAHLARLAVHPDAQNQGVGYALIRHLQSEFENPQPKRLTVNTQDDNNVSIILYKKAGFVLTNEAYPVYLHKFEK